MYLNRNRAAELGQDTVRIMNSGHYTTPAGKRVDLRETLRFAREGTRSYPPEHALPKAKAQLGDCSTVIDVVNATTLVAAWQLVQDGHRPAALNFASAKHPGGGFLSGARAQEESLARSSGLYACLEGHPMYALHAAQGDPMYTSYSIYSPAVPVFREDDGTLREEPFLCAFITAPAVNAKVVLQRRPGHGPAIRAAMDERVRRVLAIAAEHDHRALVLGAWGCGVFGNDGDTIAGLFRDALEGPFCGAFERVVFAVLDSSPEEPMIGPFRRAFPHARQA
jgi:uncharacterized protein (TIGR02452 family)